MSSDFNSYKLLVYRLGIIAICFFVGLIAGGALAAFAGQFFQPDSRSLYLAQSAAQNLVTFIVPAIAAAWIISRRPFSFLGMTEKCSVHQFVGVIIVYALALPALNQLIYYNSQISLPESLHGIEIQMKQMEDAAAKVTETILSVSDVGGLISGILLIGCLTGLAEETLFRGLFQRTLQTYPGMKQWSIWLAAFVFSAVHMQFYGFFPRLLLGAFFGYMLYSTGSLWPAVFAHALNNSMVVVTSWICNRYPGTDINPESWGVSTAGIPWMAIGSMLLLILFFVYAYRYFFHNVSISQEKEVENG